MDKKLKKLNDRIAGLRQSYDQVEKTAEELFAIARDKCGGAESYIDMLKSVSGDEDESMDARFACALAHFGVMRLILNEVEREHADLILGIDPDEPSVP